MRHTDLFHIRGNILPFTLVAGVIMAFMTILSTTIIDTENTAEANFYFWYTEKPYVIGETFTVDIMVDSRVPTNVFAGEIDFDPSILRVQSIAYNTSIADLWAEKPWYENGAGTINFAGGTTETGGFSGAGKLISITFETLRAAKSALTLHDGHILRHDGLGTDARMRPSIDTIITTEETRTRAKITDIPKPVPVVVLEKKPTTDLNGDGVTTIADVSIFMLHLASNDARSDFNENGTVDTADLSILLESR